MELHGEYKHVKGFDFNESFDFEKFVSCFGSTGFQATNLYEAIKITKMMNEKRKIPLETINTDSPYTPKTNCTIFLSYTSNMVSSGNREIIRYLVQHSLIDVIVSTAGGIEEDFIKCLSPTLLASFRLDGATLRANQLNRIGNLLVPSSNYEQFEDWITPIIQDMHETQNKTNMIWTPSSIIRHLGEKINNEESIYYWAFKNNIPVFCPAITDGSIGDMLYFYSIKNPGFKIDILDDLNSINNIAKFSLNTGMLILGGGLVKHHVCNANLMRNGADFSVFVNTAVEYDGSDAGAEPDEAVSWGKIRPHSACVKVHCDATIAFPILVAAVFGNINKK